MDIAGAAIILAAGRSTRMNSTLPKVLHRVADRPMLAYALDACRSAGIRRCCVVVGFGREQVAAAFADAPGVEFVVQEPQLGTGHAAMVCAEAFRGYEGQILVLAGDMPLLDGQVLSRLLEVHIAASAAVSLASAELPDPSSYGRIVRRPDGGVLGIVEHRDCTPEQLKIREVNISCYCFEAAALFGTLPRLDTGNDQQEYYLTDVVRLLIEDGRPAAVLSGVPPQKALGVNSPKHIAEVEQVMREHHDARQSTREIRT